MSDSNADEILKQHPLIGFSLYTHVQSEAIREIGTEIIGLMASAPLGDGKIDAEKVGRSYKLFWLWTLGAYEVLRTMAQHRGCFSEKLASEVLELKATLSKVRMPFAKQELQGGRGPIDAELSVIGFGANEDTLLFDIEGKRLDAVHLIKQVAAFFDAIQPAAIVKARPSK